LASQLAATCVQPSNSTGTKQRRTPVVLGDCRPTMDELTAPHGARKGEMTARSLRRELRAPCETRDACTLPSRQI